MVCFYFKDGDCVKDNRQCCLPEKEHCAKREQSPQAGSEAGSAGFDLLAAFTKVEAWLAEVGTWNDELGGYDGGDIADAVLARIKDEILGDSST